MDLLFTLENIKNQDIINWIGYLLISNDIGPSLKNEVILGTARKSLVYVLGALPVHLWTWFKEEVEELLWLKHYQRLLWCANEGLSTLWCRKCIGWCITWNGKPHIVGCCNVLFVVELHIDSFQAYPSHK